MKSYTNPVFEYLPSPDQSASRPVHHPVVIVGAGPVGLTTAADLAQQGVPVVLLDDDDTVSAGSRAVCYAKRTLEILDRLGCGEEVVRKGIQWSVGKVFFRDRSVCSFNLFPERGHRRPAFVNLQQYYLEEILLQTARDTGRIDLRWKNRVVSIQQTDREVSVHVLTPDGSYDVTCDWLIACDGARSPVRHAMDLKSVGRVYRDHFLITDVLMKSEYPPERWFWFDPPFNPGRSALLHKQADNVWRIDLQLGPDADPEAEKQPERVMDRLRSMLGEREFDIEWVSVYTFTCRRLEKFRHGRVIFAGDAAHQMSPFGARGANSGMQDADNLGWKLGLVISGSAPDRLLDTYSDERTVAADENIHHAMRSAEFITPHSETSRLFRDAVLHLAVTYPFARPLINSGRLSVPAVLRNSPLNTPDEGLFAGGLVPGMPALDGPVTVDGRSRWLLEFLGSSFCGMYFSSGNVTEDMSVLRQVKSLTQERIPVLPLLINPHGAPVVEETGNSTIIEDSQGFVNERYAARPGTFYLLRPDQHVCARWLRFDFESARRAVARATCND